VKGVFEEITKQVSLGKKLIALLIDPDKSTRPSIEQLSKNDGFSGLDYIFVGGSLVQKNVEYTISIIREYSDLPIILFPGSILQVSPQADALLFLSLISGRNADFLIGSHVIIAPFLYEIDLDVIPTGYMLIDGGKPTSVSYMSNTNPIPSDKDDIAVATALAGEMLGLKMIYCDTGSGAQKQVPISMIKSIKSKLKIPLIIGGGIRTEEAANNAILAGADMLVLGSIAENDPPTFIKIVKKIKGNKIA